METNENSLLELQRRLGYRFLQEELLCHALTHSSYANEHHLKREGNNERLEFLGDAVLEMISSESLYKNLRRSPAAAPRSSTQAVRCAPGDSSQGLWT